MKMKFILKKAHTYLYILIVAFFYFLAWPLFYYFSRDPTRYKTMNKIRRLWAFISSFFVGFFYRFTYEEPIDWSKPYIICPNHASNLDITAMCVLVKGDYCFIAKEELKDGLVTRMFIKTVDIPLNREDFISSVKALKKASKRLKNGINVIIFPEGKIGDEYPPVLHEFKNGVFQLAIHQKVAIIPVSSLNTWQMFWDDGLKYGSKPGICRLYVHKPIETAHLTDDDADELRDKVYAIISQKIDSSNIKHKN
jgi:1-acyl-sn-glycerol-3-phosphate acyltransferase